MDVTIYRSHRCIYISLPCKVLFEKTSWFLHIYTRIPIIAISCSSERCRMWPFSAGSFYAFCPQLAKSAATTEPEQKGHKHWQELGNLFSISQLWAKLKLEHGCFDGLPFLCLLTLSSSFLHRALYGRNILQHCVRIREKMRSPST